MDEQHLINMLIDKLPTIIAVLSVLFEISPIKFSPITIFIRWINKDTHAKLDEIENATRKNAVQIENLKNDIDKRFNKYEYQEQVRHAEQIRERLDNFAENIKLGRKYSAKQLENMYRIKDEYDVHCHKYDIQNGYTDRAMMIIRNEYEKRELGNDESED